MKKLLFAILLLLVGFGSNRVSHNYYSGQGLKLGSFSDPFLSIQLAASPANGECLTTNGTDNDWASCGGGGGAFPFTATSNYGQNANSTTTQVWFRGSPISLSASSTAQFVYGSSTAWTVSGNSYLGTVSSGVWNGTAVGIAYGGTGLTSIGASSTVLTTNGTVAQWNKLATSQLTNDSNFAAFGWPFTASSNYGFNGQSTSTFMSFTGGLAASSTSYFVYGSSTAWTVSGNSYLGTVSSGVWNGTAITVANGGTGATTLTGLLQGNGTSAITGITGTAGQFPYYNGASTLLATSSIFLHTNSFIGIATTTPLATLDVKGSIVSEEATTTSAASITLDWSKANQFNVLLNQSTTLVFSNGQPGGGYRIVACQDSVGTRYIGWPATTTLKWASNTNPTLSTAPGKCDLLTFTATMATSTGAVIFLGGSVIGF